MGVCDRGGCCCCILLYLSPVARCIELRSSIPCSSTLIDVCSQTIFLSEQPLPAPESVSSYSPTISLSIQDLHSSLPVCPFKSIPYLSFDSIFLSPLPTHH